MPRPIAKTERNLDVLRRSVRGETMVSISDDYDVSYGRLVEVVREQREKITKQHNEGIPIAELVADTSLTSDEILTIIENTERRKEERRQRWEQMNEERELRNEQYMQAVYRGDLEDHWQPIEDCPPYVSFALLFAEGHFCVGVRASIDKPWMTGGATIQPTHWMKIPGAPKEI